MAKASSSAGEEIRALLNRKALAAARHRGALARLLDLGEREVLAIQYLAQEGQLTPARLAALLHLSSGGATALVQRLEQAGHIAREPHPVDRRSTILRLTPDIERRAGEVFAPLVDDVERAVAALSKADRSAVRLFLERVADAGERRAEELTHTADVSARGRRGIPAPGLWA
jgi:DNA-binding MarR family transcriptional regulator